MFRSTGGGTGGGGGGTGGGGGGTGGGGGGGGSVTVATHQITVTYTNGGTVSPESIDVKTGKDQSFVISANAGYSIEDVLVDGVSMGEISQYTFENVTKDHTLHVVFKADVVTKFVDVPEEEWFHDSVYKAVANGWFAGTSETTFGPNVAMTRGMFTTVFYRMEQKPRVTITNLFDDVASDMYYTKGILWAAKNDVVNGYGNGLFGPDDDITREQMASILYRYANFKGYDISKTANLNSFVDANKVSEYAQNAIKWAYAEGLISGKGDGILDPQGKATRAEVASILVRFDRVFEGNK